MNTNENTAVIENETAPAIPAAQAVAAVAEAPGASTETSITVTEREAAPRQRRSTSEPARFANARLGGEENGTILPGDIYLANESRFNAAFFSEPLTDYAVGWREPNNIEALLDFIAPPVQVSRRFEYKKADNNEAFLSDSDDARAIGADFKRVEYRGASVNEKTLNRGLTIRVDLDAAGEMPNWRELYTGRLLQRMYRSELRRAIDLLVNSATNTAKTWDITAGKDPDQDILTELIAAVDSAGNSSEPGCLRRPGLEQAIGIAPGASDGGRVCILGAVAGTARELPGRGCGARLARAVSERGGHEIEGRSGRGADVLRAGWGDGGRRDEREAVLERGGWRRKVPRI
jgi:hypothetical protein